MTIDTPTFATLRERVRDYAPQLQSDGRLSWREFERSYKANPRTMKAEIIEGVVYVASSLRADRGRLHGAIMTWLGQCQAATPGTDRLDNTRTQMDADNEVHSGAMLRFAKKAGGQTCIDKGFVKGLPELVVESAVLSATIDLGDKKLAYCQAGVYECSVWQTSEQRLDWFALSDGEYVPLASDADGIARGQLFNSLGLAGTALPKDHIAAVLAPWQRRLSSAEHCAFSERTN